MGFVVVVRIATDTRSDVTPELAQQLGTLSPELLCPRLFRLGTALGVHVGSGFLLVALREG